MDMQESERNSQSSRERDGTNVKEKKEELENIESVKEEKEETDVTLPMDSAVTNYEASAKTPNMEQVETCAREKLLTNTKENTTEGTHNSEIPNSQSDEVLISEVSESVKSRSCNSDSTSVHCDEEKVKEENISGMVAQMKVADVDIPCQVANREGSSEAKIFTALSSGDSVLPSLGILPSAEEDCTPSVIEQGLTSPQPISPTPAAAESSAGSPNKEEPLQATTPAVSPTHKAEVPKVAPADISHKIKRIKWQDIEVPIITQNNNGPCPLIAILNVMILKGEITIPPERTEITGGELVLTVGNALFDLPRNSVPPEMRRYLEQNTEDAMNILDKLLTGLDVNVKFSGVRDFEFTPELCVFDLLGISLYHGWVVHPDSEAAPVVSQLSYNQLTNNIFAWREEATKADDCRLYLKAMLCEEFMTGSLSQLTIHGLFELGSTMKKEEIAVLFRNNHFSTIYKRGDVLYQLLTDQGFLHENVVWETLTDVDANFSEFVTATFQAVVPPPNVQTGQTATMTQDQQINSDHQLAELLQREADFQQREQQQFEHLKDALGLHHVTDEEMARRLQEEENKLATQNQVGSREEGQHVGGGGGGGGGGGEYPSSLHSQHPSHYHSRPSSPGQQSEEKKKKDCVIL